MELQWPLIIFTLLICLGAGTFGVTGLLAALGKGDEIRFPALIVSLVAVVAGGLASVLHLQHWERVFNGFGNPTSGITQEIVGIAIVVIVAIVYLVMSRRGETPKWIGWAALVVSVLLVIAMAHSYAMPSRPLWDSVLLYIYYLANAILFGSLVVTLLFGLKDGDTGLAGKVAIGGGVAQVVVMLGYAILIPFLGASFTTVGNYFDSTDPTKAMQNPSAVFSSFLTGDYALLFWGGALILGAALPLVIAIISHKKSGTALVGSAGVGVASALLGGVAFRALLYLLGFTTFVFY
ncbi:MAG: hypothetical protein LBL27_04030 [Coriobacteriales bacterium]|jgi:anaerobic dimethyl sulfoxide reductase subunit C (anchor subunit)|nr:hypothetical protein [Coriobacteriales bacterium]